MATYSTLQSSIADKLMRSDLTSEIAYEINQSIEFFAKERFYFTETTGTFTFIQGQKSYGVADGIPSNIKAIDLIQITLGSNNFIYPNAISYQEVERMDPSSAQGQPYYYAYYQGKLYFYPLPNSTYTVTISYQKNYSDLSAGSDSNDFTSGIARDLVEARTCKNLYSAYIKDVDSAQIEAAREQEFLMQLRAETERVIGNSRMTPTKF